MNENDSSTNETHDHPALAMENHAPIEYEDGEPGRWVRDPDDPAFEIWEPVDVEDSQTDEAEQEPPVVVATRGFDANRKPKEVVWGDGRTPNPDRVCTARKTNGQPCTRIAIAGGNVCPAHGGLAPHIQAKARARLQDASDRMARRLLRFTDDENVPPAVQLAATRDALDRAGLSAKTAVEVEVGPNKGFQDILNAMMAGGSRAESRSRRGVTDEPAQDDWIAQELAVVDAEVVDDPVVSPAPRPEPPAPRPDDHRDPRDDDGGFQSMEDALTQLRAAPIPQHHRRDRH
ncbi:hypothetical protein VZC37_01420 [Gordonia sp. LSe1-13]|uniref:Uncharacterized protein n=1 Tax=Gordonia sesuvii TaxID=3116777 RepID=A0ABU7M787_9ACTN|nr:hypothetical protein [Gordonia sp. LSe1-13]